MFEQLKEILIVLTPIITTVGVAYLGYKGKKRDQERNDMIVKRDEEVLERFDARMGIVIDRIESIEGVVNGMEESLKQHLCDNDFRQDYRNALRNTAVRILENSHQLKQDYKNMLSYYADSIEKFGLSFYYSIRRKEGGHSLEKYLKQEKMILIEDFSKYISTHIDTIRKMNGKRIDFANFLLKTGIYNNLEIVIMTLVKNGLKEKDVIDLFSQHIDKFCELFITSTITWETFEDINKEAA